MKKRKTKDNNNFEPKDNPIGLTEAFPPIKSTQSVDYDKGDDPLGLTQAFAPVQKDEEAHPWDKAGKWDDFDWEASNKELHEESKENDFSQDKSEKDQLAKLQETQQANNDSSDLDTPKDSVLESQESIGSDKETGELPPQEQLNVSSKDESVNNQENVNQEALSSNQVEEVTPQSKPSDSASAAQPANETMRAVKSQGDELKKKGPKHGRHAAPVKELSPRMKKSRRTRRVLIVLIILLFVAVGAVGIFMYHTWIGSHQEAAQQVQDQAGAPNHRDDVGHNYNDDTKEKTTKLVDLPELSRVIGMNEGDAMNFIKRGAVITANNPVNEEGNPIKTNLTVALTEEVSGGKTGGTPTVYLGLNEEGRIIQVGCSAAVPSLGYSALSFSDAINVDRVIEKTLARVGVVIPEGTAVLPANKDEYSTYASDGTTVVRERCSFEGDVDVHGTPCSWSTVLSYDYTTQVVTGNLNDTVRIIYVYITVK